MSIRIILKVSHQRSRLTIMGVENILCVEQNKLEGADGKFKNQLRKQTILDVVNLNIITINHSIHSTFAGSIFVKSTNVFLLQDMCSDSFEIEEQSTLNDLKY
ncbi:MAG: hypothetical protein EZS28_052340, partial [Streblomastix strix]